MKAYYMEFYSSDESESFIVCMVKNVEEEVGVKAKTWKVIDYEDSPFNFGYVQEARKNLGGKILEVII